MQSTTSRNLSSFVKTKRLLPIPGLTLNKVLKLVFASCSYNNYTKLDINNKMRNIYLTFAEEPLQG